VIKKKDLLPTQETVARESGVSRATVSLILRGGPLALRYSEETRKKVWAAAERLHYRPSRAAQSMRKRRSNLIALVHFGAGISAAGSANRMLSQELTAAGYDFLAIDMNWHGSVERVLSELIQFRVEGVIISHIQHVFSQEQIDVLRQAGIPVVAVNGECREGVPLFGDDVESAFFSITDHLLEKGHRLLVHLSSSNGDEDLQKIRPNCLRVEGFRRAVEQKGRWLFLPEDEFFRQWPAFDRRSVLGITVCRRQPKLEFLQRFFETRTVPDALVCPNDALAVDAILTALAFDLRVPRDFAITGYDNDPSSRLPSVDLTTAEQDLPGICRAAVEALVKMIEQPGCEVSGRTFPSRLFIRSSSGR